MVPSGVNKVRKVKERIATIVIQCAFISTYLGFSSESAHAYQGMPAPKLHISGRFLQDPNGKNVTLHGYMQPGASWFNGEGHNFADPTDFTSTTNVAPALNYYNAVADIFSHTGALYGQSHGWYCSFVRYIGDGGSVSNFAPGWDASGNLANSAQFNGWMQNVLVPYVDHCRADGLYVVLCGNPSEAFPGGDATKNMTQQYQQNLITFWTAVASYPGIKGADNVMFEICNEPIAIETSFGANDWGSGSDAYDAAITNFMQPVVDAIRAQNADNVIWIPGLGWQGQYTGFANHPIQNAGNIGYAAHIYPAYGGAHDNATLVANLWNSNYKPAADQLPMIITEMMWNPNDGTGYQDLWNAHTSGFGNAIRSCIDNEGNVSYVIGMVGDHLANLNSGLASTTLSTAEGSQAAFNWYSSYSGAAPSVPVGPAAGVYEISPTDDISLAMDVYGNFSANGTRIDQWHWTGGANQKFYFHPLGNNTYWLEPQNALGSCLDVININPNDGAGLQIWPYWGGLGQQWIVIGLGNGDYRFAPVLNPTRTLDQPGGSTQPNLVGSPNAPLNLQTYFWWGAIGQKWKLIAR